MSCELKGKGLVLHPICVNGRHWKAGVCVQCQGLPLTHNEITSTIIVITVTVTVAAVAVTPTIAVLLVMW